VAFPDEPDPVGVLASDFKSQYAKDVLFDLVIEFLSERDENNGLRNILTRYFNWLTKQPWYDENVDQA
jgi:hypothetical protein